MYVIYYLVVSPDLPGRKMEFTPISLANAAIVDPKISMDITDDLQITLSAQGGVAPWTWVDHPLGTVGVFVDAVTGKPTNGFYLIPGVDRTCERTYITGVAEWDNLRES